MRLLNVTTLQLESFSDWSSTPPYLILSHAWGFDEVTFDDITETEEESDIRKIHAQLHDLQPNTCSSSFRPAISEAGIDYSHLPHLKYSVVQKKGWAKIEGCLREAKKYALKYIWCDTCCIDKSSSAELSEAINSMWDWYRDASWCVAYLSDVNPLNNLPEYAIDGEGDWNVWQWDWMRIEVWKSSYNIFARNEDHRYNKDGSENEDFWKDEFKPSRWFERGWTLQELIAPREVVFFRKDWTLIGTRRELAKTLAELTLIPKQVFTKRDGLDLNKYSIAERMLWASRRFVTREEDHAYSLLGLFGVSLPVIYGEGLKKAFYRLQIEVFGATADQSMLAWKQMCPLWVQTETFDYETCGREDYWNEYIDTDPDGGHWGFQFHSLFSPSIHYYASSYNIVERPMDIDVAINTVVPISDLEAAKQKPGQIIGHQGRFLHATPIRLPMLPLRRLSIEPQGIAHEYRAILACGPEEDPKKRYTVKMVLFENEKGVPWRVLPHTLDLIDVYDLETDKLHIHSLNMPMPKADTPVSFAKGSSKNDDPDHQKKYRQEMDLLSEMLKGLSTGT